MSAQLQIKIYKYTGLTGKGMVNREGVIDTHYEKLLL